MEEITAEISTDPGPTLIRITSDGEPIHATVHQALGVDYDLWKCFDEKVRFALTKSAVRMLTAGLKGKIDCQLQNSPICPVSDEELTQLEGELCTGTEDAEEGP